MSDFIKWLHSQSEYKALVQDGGSNQTLRSLMSDMLMSEAGPEAWRMLFNAIHACPLPLPSSWPREAFKPHVDVEALMYVVLDYVHGPTPGMVPMSDRNFAALTKTVRVLWAISPSDAEAVINAQRCSSVQYCLLLGLKE